MYSPPPFKRLGSVRLLIVFERSLLCSPRLHLFDNYCELLLKFKVTVFYYTVKCFFFPVMEKLNFQQLLLLFHKILQKPFLYADLVLKKLILSKLKTVVLLNIYVWYFFFIWWIETSKEQHLFKKKCFVTLIRSDSKDICNLLHPRKKIRRDLTDLKLLNRSVYLSC